MNYSDVFGDKTIAPSNTSFNSLSITEDTELFWPDNYSGVGAIVASVIELEATPGIVVTLPVGTEVSPGTDFIIRNVGGYSVSIEDQSETVISTLVPGAALYLYLTDNTTYAGTWGVVAFGIGTSLIDAATLAGYGFKVIGLTLNQSHPITFITTTTTITDSYRAKMIVYTGGVGVLTLPTAASAGDDFFFMIRNSGTGSLTLSSTETIDSNATLVLNPSESAFVICSGSNYFTVGLGRSLEFAYTQLIKDISADGGDDVTLTYSEAKNSLLTFIGSPTDSVTIIVPNIVSIYYAYNNLTTAENVILKTETGLSVTVAQGERSIVFCDGVDIVSAQSAIATSSISLINGSPVAPSLNFSSRTNTGLFKSGAQDLGITVNGSTVATFTSSGLVLTYGLSTESVDMSPFARTLLDDIDAAAMRATLEIVSSDDAQPLDLDLTALANVSSLGLLTRTGLGTATTRTLSSLNPDINFQNGNGVAGDPKLYLTGNLAGIEQLSTVGIVRRVGLTEFSAGGKVSLVTEVTGSLPIANMGASTFIKTLLDDADATAARATLGIAEGIDYLSAATANSLYQSLDTELTALASVTSAADKVPYFTGSGTASTTTVTSFARTLLDDIDATTMRTTLGVDSVGIDQDWVDVTASRAVNIAYRNETGRPIQISIACAEGGGSSGSILVGTSSTLAANPKFGVSDVGVPVTLIIPSLYYYGVIGAATINKWMELG